MAKLIELRNKMVTILVAITAMVQTSAESSKTPAVRSLIDNVSETQLLSVLTEKESGTLRVPMIQLIEEHEAEFAELSASGPDWEKTLEEVKKQFQAVIEKDPKIKDVHLQTPNSRRIFRMLSEMMAVKAKQANAKQLEDSGQLEEKLSVALEKYHRDRVKRSAEYEAQREAYQVKRKRLVKKYGKKWVEALENDAEAWYEHVVRQHDSKKMNSNNR